MKGCSPVNILCGQNSKNRTDGTFWPFYLEMKRCMECLLHLLLNHFTLWRVPFPFYVFLGQRSIQFCLLPFRIKRRKTIWVTRCFGHYVPSFLLLWRFGGFLQIISIGKWKTLKLTICIYHWYFYLIKACCLCVFYFDKKLQ